MPEYHRVAGHDQKDSPEAVAYNILDVMDQATADDVLPKDAKQVDHQEHVSL